MRPVNIGNVFGTQTIHVRGGLNEAVVLAYEAVSMSFWYIMTTDQAREMAAALIAFSDIQDAKVEKGE